MDKKKTNNQSLHALERQSGRIRLDGRITRKILAQEKGARLVSFARSVKAARIVLENERDTDTRVAQPDKGVEFLCWIYRKRAEDTSEGYTASQAVDIAGIDEAQAWAEVKKLARYWEDK